MHATGIPIGNQEVAEIALTSSTEGLKIPYGAVYSGEFSHNTEDEKKFR